jgi:hypothetical protein
MSELVLFNDIIYAFRDVPQQHVENFSNQFSFVGVGTAQRQFVTKASVKDWLKKFDRDSLNRFRDFAFLLQIIERQSEYILKDGMLYFNGVLLHEEISSKDQILDTYEQYSALYNQIMSAIQGLPNSHNSNAYDVKARLNSDFEAMNLRYDEFKLWQTGALE